MLLNAGHSLVAKASSLAINETVKNISVKKSLFM